MSKTCKCAEDYIKQIRQLQDEVVFGMYEDEYPMYVQGYTKGLHELSSPMTATEANGLIKVIRRQNVLINKAIQLEEYQKEQEADLLHLLKQAKVDRLGELEADPLPQPKKEIRTKGHDKDLTRHPGKIVPDWDGELDTKDLDLGDLM